MKKKQYVTCELDSTSPKEGEGGRLMGGIFVGCEPICYFPQNLYILSQALFLIPGKPCCFCWLNLCVLQFVSHLIVFGNNLKA